MAEIVEKRILTEEEIKALCDKYRPLMPHERVKELYKDFNAAEVMLTSSFAATSAFLLKIFSDINKDQTIYFIDTGYHFEETLAYRNYLSFLYDLKVEAVSADEDKHAFTKQDETWSKNPDFCCSINKVEPLNALKDNYTVWVSGLMAWQSDHRKSLDIFEQRGGILKFYPLLDVTSDERELFISSHKLPFHPLVNKGYSSIGCTHCTAPGEDRSGRWNNNPKTECGLHL